MKLNLMPILGALFALSACTPPAEAPSELEGDWLVQQIAGASLNAEERIHFSVDVEAGAMRGSTGCNDFTAQVTLFESAVTISNIAEAEGDGACPSEAAATNEARFLGVLPSVARFHRRGASLELLARDPAPDALILARTDNVATPTE